MNSALHGRSIVLAGGAGFIGHHLALACRAQGAVVTVVDCLLHHSPSLSPLHAHLAAQRIALLATAKIPIYRLDARRGPEFMACLESARPDAIVHLAAIGSAKLTAQDPGAAESHGCETLAHSLHFARTHRCHLVYISSSMVYGHFARPVALEDDPPAPVNLYGCLKLRCEQMIAAAAPELPVPASIVRPSAVYGERCLAQPVAQTYIEAALNQAPLLVNGDGTEPIDFTCVHDLIQGLLLCLVRPEARGQTLNLTYGAARTLNDLIAILRLHLPALTVRRQERDGQTPRRGALSVAKARRLLSYAPVYPLERGYPQYLDSYRRLLASDPALFNCAPGASSKAAFA